MQPALLLAVLASSAIAAPVRSHVGPRASGPTNLPILHEPRAYSSNHAERDLFHRNNILATRYKYLETEGERDAFRREVSERVDEENVPYADWERDLMYSIPIEVGTPPQTFEVHMDTGSASTYVYDKNCTARACNGANVFDHEASSSFAMYNTTARQSLTYGSGYASGKWATDTISVGGTAVDNQVFMAVDVTDSSYSRSNVTGLIGFSFQGIAVAQETPYWVNAAENWDDKRFGCHLERLDWPDPWSAPPKGATPGGTLTLGGVDESLFTGDIKYLPVESDQFWKIAFDGVKVDGNIVTGEASDAVVDTGTTLCYGPPEALETMFAAIPGAAPSSINGFYEIPCDTPAKVEFVLGGESYPMFARDLIFRNATAERDNRCLSSFMAGSPKGIAAWLLGDAFLKNVYSVYRLEPKSFGVAHLKDQPSGSVNACPSVDESTSASPSASASETTSSPIDDQAGQVDPDDE